MATSMATDFLSGPSAAPSNTSNKLTAAISFRSAAALHRRERRRFQPRLRARGLCPGLRHGISVDLEAAKRATCIQRLKNLWMELAEMAEHQPGAELDQPGAAGMIPVRGSCLEL